MRYQLTINTLTVPSTVMTAVPIPADPLCLQLLLSPFPCSSLVYMTDDNVNHFICTALPLVKPRPPTATSIPAILKSLQDEWVLTSHSVYADIFLLLRT